MDLEALRYQVSQMEQQREIERQEWKVIEIEHQRREQSMLKQIQYTQAQLEHVLAECRIESINPYPEQILHPQNQMHERGRWRRKSSAGFVHTPPIQRRVRSKSSEYPKRHLPDWNDNRPVQPADYLSGNLYQGGNPIEQLQQDFVTEDIPPRPIYTPYARQNYQGSPQETQFNSQQTYYDGNNDEDSDDEDEEYSFSRTNPNTSTRQTSSWIPPIRTPFESHRSRPRTTPQRNPLSRHQSKNQYEPQSPVLQPAAPKENQLPKQRNYDPPFSMPMPMPMPMPVPVPMPMPQPRIRHEQPRSYKMSTGYLPSRPSTISGYPIHPLQPTHIMSPRHTEYPFHSFIQHPLDYRYLTHNYSKHQSWPPQMYTLPLVGHPMHTWRIPSQFAMPVSTVYQRRPYMRGTM
ncbi:hypothetical protein F4703DRAFT_1899183 [Phycomyces blakesleeanus]